MKQGPHVYQCQIVGICFESFISPVLLSLRNYISTFTEENKSTLLVNALQYQSISFCIYLHAKKKIDFFTERERGFNCDLFKRA